jgi:hypothetical protein
MPDQPHLRQSSVLTAIAKVANRPHITADRIYIAGRRGFLVLLASGVAIQAWALFPSPDESGHDVRLPETSTPSAADDNSARRQSARALSGKCIQVDGRQTGVVDADDVRGGDGTVLESDD